MNDQGPPVKPLHPLNLTAEQDARLIRNGYEPVAVEGKRALGDEWSKRLNTIKTIAAERKALPHAVSTGLRTGQLAAIDVDVGCGIYTLTVKGQPYDLAFSIHGNARSFFGVTPLARIVQKGLMLRAAATSTAGSTRLSSRPASGWNA